MANDVLTSKEKALLEEAKKDAKGRKKVFTPVGEI